MKKIVCLTLLLLFLTAANSFALYVDVVPSGTTTGSSSSSGGTFLGMYYVWDSNGDGDLSDDNYHNPISTDYPYYNLTYAGQFDLTFKESQTGNILSSSFGFCIDLTELAGGGIAILENITTETLVQASWLVSEFWTYSNSSQQNAGLQMAIWDTLYSDLPNDDSFDRFQVFSYLANDPDPDDQTKYNEYDWHLDYMSDLAAADLSDFDTSLFKVVDFDGEHQNMLTMVPEPSTMLLLGLGLLGISAAGRKRKI